MGDRSMQRLLDIVALLLMTCAASAFMAAVYMLVLREDYASIFLLAVGTILMRAAVDMLRPRSAS